MTSKTKVLDFIYAMVDSHQLESDWEPELERLNIWDDVFDIYTRVPETSVISRLEANTIFAFIVLAYDNRSGYLEPHKDRFDNKVKIITKLAGPSALVNTLYRDVVYCQDRIINKVISWYIDFQKDYRWRMILTNKEYSSQAQSMARTGANSSKDGLDMGKMLKEAAERDREADSMLDTLRTEFLNLDTVLTKEKRPKATDLASTNFMSHEGFITSLNKRVHQETMAEKNAKEDAKKKDKETTT